MNKNQIVSRLLQMVIVLIGISFLTFLLTYLSPGDPARNIFTHSGVMPSQEMIEDMRRTLGLDKPFFTQYKDWLFNCLQGNFGDSFMLQKPVAELLMERLWPTLKLTLASTVLMLLFSVPLGVISAVNHNKPVDYFVRAITFFGVSIPNFWLGLMLILIFCAGRTSLGLCDRRPGPWCIGKQDPVGQCAAQLPVAADYHAGSVHRLIAGRYQRS